MKIAVLHWHSPQSSVQPHKSGPDPSIYTKDHNFEHFEIRTGHEKEEVDDVVAKGFDFFFNFMVAGDSGGSTNFDGMKYFEALELDHIGALSSTLDSRKQPHITPAAGVQEYSCFVIQIYETPFALSPILYSSGSEKKHHNILEERDDSSLFQMLKKKSVEYFQANKLGNVGWCSLGLSIGLDGEPEIVAATPVPPIFLPHKDWEDHVIEHSFPGGHYALISTLIASFYLRKKIGNPSDNLAAAYDKTASSYNDGLHANSKYSTLTAKIAAKYNFEGSILDLGSGTGMFGRLLYEASGVEVGKKSVLTGIDISKEMVTICQKENLYQDLQVGPIQRILPSFGTVDHIVSCGALYFLSREDFFLTLACCFFLAQESISVTIEEPPTAYYEKVQRSSHLSSCLKDVSGHIEDMEAFGEPSGWKLASRFKDFGFSIRGDDVYTTVFRFERDCFLVK